MKSTIFPRNVPGKILHKKLRILYFVPTTQIGAQFFFCAIRAIYVPKKKDGPEWGIPFTDMKEKIYLTDEEYQSRIKLIKSSL